MLFERYLFDTSALITLLEDEPGADQVAHILNNAKVWIPWLALLEMHYITWQEKDEAAADDRYAYVQLMPVTILWEITEPILLTATRFKANHRLSLGDAIIAAIALQNDFVLLHKDPEFEALSAEIQLQALPYKTS